MNVRALDPHLPKSRFDEWFPRQPGEPTIVNWAATDCGEGDGPANGRDMPLCAEATAKISEGRLVVAQILVATSKKGVHGKPALWSVALLTKDGKYHSVRHLSELRALLTQTR